jgi:hypothetical protein
MRPRDHLILGTGASAAVYHTLGPSTVIFWVATFMIDIDHYMNFVYHNGLKDLSFRGMFDYYAVLDKLAHLPEFLDIEVFHSGEFMFLLYLVSYWSGSSVLRAVMWGFIFHIVLDWISLASDGIFFKRANFVAEYFIRKKGLMRTGLNPVDVYNEALRDSGNTHP